MTSQHAAEIHPLAGENRLLADCREVETEPLALRQRRRRARDRFRALGFPTTRQEEWRHTNIAPLTKIPLAPATRGRLKAEDLAPFTYPDMTRLVFLNGFFAPEHSEGAELPSGCVLGSLAQILVEAPERLESELGHYAQVEDQPFVALNTSCWRDGAFLYVPSGVVIEKPIHLIFVASTPDQKIVAYPRTFIQLGAQSQATVLETYAGLEAQSYFTCPVTELVIGEGAVLDYTLIQRESRDAYHVGTVQLHLERNSSLHAHSFDLGGILVRHDLKAVVGEGAHCILDGLYLTSTTQLIDNHLYVDHTRPHGTSQQRYRGILDGEARGVFKGRICVQRDAQKTNAQQINRNLLLSREALVYTNPQLEILANDVKCTHGATVGQLDQEALFYLRSRGIGAEAARALLIFAFARDLLAGLQVEAVRLDLEAQIFAQLNQPTL